MKVVIFQYRLFHYRVDLFERLRAACVARGIQLELVTGQAFGKERLKNDEGELSWAHRVRNVYFPIVEKKDLCWQPMPRGLKDVDLVMYNHVGSNLSTSWGDSGGNGMVSIEYLFEGETAHSAGAPWRGRSALDAVELMNVGWNYRREHLRL